MRKFFDRLTSLVSRGWQRLRRSRVAHAAARAYAKAVVQTSGPILGWAYARNERRSKFFNTTWGRRILRSAWEVAIVATVAFNAISGVGRWITAKTAPVVVFVVAVALTVAALIWAVASIAFTLVLAFFMWAANSVRHLAVTGFRAAWYRATEDRGRVARRITRYATFREVLAFYLGGLVVVHAGAARLSRRVIGDGLTHLIVHQTADVVARLHPATYDFWFNEELPYGVPDEAVHLHIVDHSDLDEDLDADEETKTANFFRNAGFVLISENQPGKSDKDIFNEYARERWADIQAAEIATDTFGRTWVVPFPDRPLLKSKDVSLSTEVNRKYADQEMSWLTETDLTERSFKYGRHWAAALADQDEEFLTSSEMQKRERSLLFARVNSYGADLHTKHVLRGYDAFVSDHSVVDAT